MNICKSWEKEFFKTNNREVRKIALRTSIVLGNNGGAFPKLKMITKLGLGGKQGRGNQMVSWIHINDFCKAVEWIIQHENISGAINVTAPAPLSNSVMMEKLRKTESSFRAECSCMAAGNSFHIPENRNRITVEKP